MSIVDDIRVREGTHEVVEELPTLNQIVNSLVEKTLGEWAKNLFTNANFPDGMYSYHTKDNDGEFKISNGMSRIWADGKLIYDRDKEEGNG